MADASGGNSVRDPGILTGVDEIIEFRLDIPGIGSRPPRYRNRKVARELSARRSALGAAELVDEIFDQIHSNWRSFAGDRQPSLENWRFEKQLHIAPGNESREKTLEKAIARAAGEAWVNQVPTASGLVSASVDRSRNLDLVYRSAPARFEFIELKVESDNPLYAAMEILKSGVLYIFARSSFSSTAQGSSPILNAKTVHLRVLAPSNYYRGYRFDWLETALTIGLQNAITKRVLNPPCTMDFMFNAFPSSFDWPCCDEALLCSLAGRAPVKWSD